MNLSDYQALLRASPHPCLVMRPDLTIVAASTAYLRLVRRTESDLVGRYLFDAFPEDPDNPEATDIPEVRASLLRALANGEPDTTAFVRYSLPVETPQGRKFEERYWSAVHTPVLNDEGRPILLVQNPVDLTELYRNDAQSAAARLHQAQAAKRESEERLRDGMDAAKMVVWDWDVATGALAHSDNMTLVLGCAPDMMQALHRHIHPDDWERVARSHRTALAETGAYQEVARFIRPDNNKQIWVDSRGKVQYGADGLPARIRGVTMDVTERYQAELELRETSRKKDEFLAMLAHELRNPLAPISTAAEILKLSADSDPRTRRASEVISRQVKHMTTLVDDLLDVSRVTRGLVRLEQECVDIKLAVANAVEQARPLIEARRHVLTVLTGAAPAMVNGDRTRLVQVVANLLNNAAKYTPQGGAITLEVGVDAAMVHISVSDNGIGINAALLPHIFDLFTQAERTPDRAQGGLGIGLALVRTIVTLHGGIVTAHSDGPGLGSMFNIALPAAAQLATQSAAQLATQSAATGYPGALRDEDTPTLAAAAPASSRVMIVDDNIDAAALLAELLGAQGHQVSVLPHPFDALAAARLHPPRAFILDIGLPEIDGYELARRLRAEPGNAQALFIALTGYGQEHDRILSRHAGFDHHFVKPVDVARLSEVLAELDA